MSYIWKFAFEVIYIIFRCWCKINIYLIRIILIHIIRWTQSKFKESQSTSDKTLQSVSDLIKESTSFQSQATKGKWNRIQMWLSMRHWYQMENIRQLQTNLFWILFSLLCIISIYLRLLVLYSFNQMESHYYMLNIWLLYRLIRLILLVYLR